MRHYSKLEVAVKFKRYIRVNFNSQADAGLYYEGVSRQFISAVCNGKKAPNAEMLDDLGLERVTVYVRAK
jgi:hypothetical protein